MICTWLQAGHLSIHVGHGSCSWISWSGFAFRCFPTESHHLLFQFHRGTFTPYTTVTGLAPTVLFTQQCRTQADQYKPSMLIKGHSADIRIRCFGGRLCVGLAVLPDAASRVWTSSEPPVDGIFPLELTLFLTPFPQNSFGGEYKLKSIEGRRCFAADSVQGG